MRSATDYSCLGFPRFMETLSTRPVSSFEVLPTQASEMTVTARLIVEGSDVRGQIGRRQISVLLDLFLDPFFLQATEQGLGDRVVSAAVRSAVHAELLTVSGQMGMF